MQMDSGIILAGQQPDLLNVLAQSDQAANNRNVFARQREIEELYRTQGPGIAAGDPNALNALAQFDPAAALGIQDKRQGMAFDAERMQMARDQAKQAALQWAQQQDAATVAREAEGLANGLKGAAVMHQRGDRQGYDAFLRQQGLDPAQYPFDQFPAVAAQVEGVLEVWQQFAPLAPPDPTKGAPSGYMFTDPANPAAGVAPLPGYKAQPGVVVNTGDMGADIGTIPQGYAAIPDANSPAGYRMERIPGGPEDNAETKALAAEGVSRAAAVVIEDIGRLRNLVSDAPFYNPATGFGAESVSKIGGTNAANAKALIDPIIANVGFDRLQQMREASPTGGALGAISDTEMRLLSAVLGSLAQTQDKKQLMENLDRLEVIYSGIAAKAAAYPGGSGEAPSAPVAAPDGLTDEDMQYLGGP